MPGMRDRVSIGNKVYKQKKMLLANLRELHADFKQQYPHNPIGFSKFCTLRPRWCVLAGESGTHSVCVCTYHQNVVLMFEAVDLGETYQDFFKRLVCDTSNRDCMLRRCDKCPSVENAQLYLMSALESFFEDEAEIDFYQWDSKARSTLKKVSLHVEEFIELLLQQLEALLPHSYIAKAQSLHLKNVKQSLSQDEAIVITDFSENYGYIVQDASQGFHWNKDACTIFPAVLYYRNSEEALVPVSLCIISDDMNHDVSMVYQMQCLVTDFLRSKHPRIKKLHYFSDGCAGQFKNTYNFLNLLHHFKDFQLEADWSFFATSHGKTECDGVGGTVKRLARKASLQRPYSNPLISAKEVFDFATAEIKNVVSFHVLKSAVDSLRDTLQSRFSIATTVPGTRSFHYFERLSSFKLITKRISADQTTPLVFDYDKNDDTFSKVMEELYENCYVACFYDQDWYFGVVEELHKDEQDVKVRFMHPNGPTTFFYWPRKEDICIVPVSSIISIVDPPRTTTSGRTFVFSQEVIDTVVESVEMLRNSKN
ncbi:unnamed protein product [Bemisia tabaci]|uniref:Uncharacterized protein n=1 Tax=Bemisia tabaci TaxID=7038 RepID=A0A9P0F909_BEMTA|nr:unnamed protein product [Bemisia tabaci]